jgi:hypothetical protein
MKFLSTTPGSGNNLQWKIRLPQPDPIPTQDGTVVANFELYVTFWFSLILCNPASTPFGPCTPNSDANTPTAAGSANLELQFYPPGVSGLFGCSNTQQWCARMNIFELTGNMNCLEPVHFASITTNGSRSGPQLLMSPGDSLLITIKDTPNGLETDVSDLTSSQTGSMVASIANGFTQTHAADCTTTPFAYHPEYSTASPGNVGSWFDANVNLAFEIGHWELCGNASCSILPDADVDDTECETVLGVGGCMSADTDHNGTSYLTDWPDGSTSHPSTLIIGSPSDNGVGPLSVSDDGSYQNPYGSIEFQAPQLFGGSFYPFFSQAGTGASCVFNFGNDIPSTTTNDFGKTVQYGTTIDNPCLSGVPPAFSLTVVIAGSGSGTVTSEPPGIDCPPDCQATYTRDTVVILTPTPGPRAVFREWGGDPDCSNGVVTMDADKTCVANFKLDHYRGGAPATDLLGENRVTIQ